MMAMEVVNASSSDESPIVNTIVLAFSTDPMTRWCWPDAHQYLAIMPNFIKAFGGRAFQSDSAHCTNDRRGAALWLPPGTGPDEEAMAQIAEDGVSPAVRGDVYGLMEKMAHYHPNEPRQPSSRLLAQLRRAVQAA